MLCPPQQHIFLLRSFHLSVASLRPGSVFNSRSLLSTGIHQESVRALSWHTIIFQVRLDDGTSRLLPAIQHIRIRTLCNVSILALHRFLDPLYPPHEHILCFLSLLRNIKLDRSAFFASVLDSHSRLAIPVFPKHSASRHITIHK